MADRPLFAIVGSGLAGTRAAEVLRQEGFDGRILLCGAEPDPPYDRPPLSKEFLAGEAEEDAIALHPAGFYAEREIELELGRAVQAIDPGARRLTWADGRSVRYDKLLLATGSRLRRLPLPGGDLEGIFYLRTLADARRLRQALAGAERVVVVGAGFIGCEVAAVARRRGAAVTLLEALPAPLHRVLGAQAGERIARLHRDHGVDVRCAVSVEACVGEGGRLRGVRLAGGEVLPCEACVVGVGVVPAADLAAAAGIDCADGVRVNEFCETSAPDVLAAGDVASWPYRGGRLRVEHWDNALNQARTAARTMLGKREPYAPVPYFWSDQYDWKLQYLGHAVRWDRVVVRGDLAGDSWALFYLEGGRPAAALVVNRPREIMAIRRLMAAGAAVSAAALADPSTDLRTLGRE
jgi:3-phenylpropionate/trans-cinnamate dioxygenase ferredoxin reductase subunit